MLLDNLESSMVTIRPYGWPFGDVQVNVHGECPRIDRPTFGISFRFQVTWLKYQQFFSSVVLSGIRIHAWLRDLFTSCVSHNVSWVLSSGGLMRMCARDACGPGLL